jgi:hypothetical protein
MSTHADPALSRRRAAAVLKPRGTAASVPKLLQLRASACKQPLTRRSAFPSPSACKQPPPRFAASTVGGGGGVRCEGRPAASQGLMDSASPAHSHAAGRHAHQGGQRGLLRAPVRSGSTTRPHPTRSRVVEPALHTTRTGAAGGHGGGVRLASARKVCL